VRGAEKQCDANFNANLKIGYHADEVENFAELRGKVIAWQLIELPA
jgi:hypothetical protein